MLNAIHSDITYDHLIYLPEEYDARQKWPVIFYLHGVGGQDDYLEILKRTDFQSCLSTGLIFHSWSFHRSALRRRVGPRRF